MTGDEIKTQIEKIDSTLKGTLTEDDYADLRDAYKEINAQIRWGRLVNRLLPAVMEGVENVVFRNGEFGGEYVTKHHPFYNVGHMYQEALEADGDPKAMGRRHLIVLLLVKKLLGAMKTNIHQKQKDVRILSVDEEDHLREASISLEDLQGKVQEESEAEDTPVHEVRAEIFSPSPQNVDLSPFGTCLDGGNHIRARSRIVHEGDILYLVTRCLDCRREVSRKPCAAHKETPKKCLHTYARWRAGEEGKVAECSACQHTIPRPERFHWEDSGLEPFGDDPTKDEVIVLCTEY